MRDEGGRALQDLLLFPALQSTSPETKNDRDSSCRWLHYVLQKLFRKLDAKLRMLCSTLVCEVTTPSLHSHIPRSARGLLLRLNAIVMNPLPFWLKILETFLLYCLGLLLLILRHLPRLRWLSSVRNPSTSFCVKVMRRDFPREQQRYHEVSSSSSP